MKNKAKALVLSAALLSSTANAIDLSGTIFDKAAKAYNLDPLLVYSVAKWGRNAGGVRQLQVYVLHLC